MLVGSKVMCEAVLRGAQSMASFMFATLIDLVIRVALCFALDPVLGVEGVWWSWPIGWGVATAVSAALYFSGMWYKSAHAKARFAALAAAGESSAAAEAASGKQSAPEPAIRECAANEAPESHKRHRFLPFGHGKGGHDGLMSA